MVRCEVTSGTSQAPGAAPSTTSTSRAPAAPTAGASELLEPPADEVEVLRTDQRRLRSRVGDLKDAVDELRTQYGIALLNFTKNRDNRDRDIACVLAGLQAQVLGHDGAIKEITKEVVRASQQTSHLASSSLDFAESQHCFEKRLAAMERLLDALSLEDEDYQGDWDQYRSSRTIGATPLPGLGGAGEPGSESALPRVRSRLSRIRASLLSHGSTGTCRAEAEAQQQPPKALADGSGVASTTQLGPSCSSVSSSPDMPGPDACAGTDGGTSPTVSPHAAADMPPTLQVQQQQAPQQQQLRKPGVPEEVSLVGPCQPQPETHRGPAVLQVACGDAGCTEIEVLRRQQAELQARVDELWAVQVEAQLDAVYEGVVEEAAVVMQQLKEQCCQEVAVELQDMVQAMYVMDPGSEAARDGGHGEGGADAGAELLGGLGFRAMVAAKTGLPLGGATGAGETASKPSADFVGELDVLRQRWALQPPSEEAERALGGIATCEGSAPVDQRSLAEATGQAGSRSGAARPASRGREGRTRTAATAAAPVDATSEEAEDDREACTPHSAPAASGSPISCTASSFSRSARAGRRGAVPTLWPHEGESKA